MNVALEALKIIGLISGLIITFAMMCLCVYGIYFLAKDHPWSVVGALPLFVVFIWAAYANTPMFGWRLLIALTFQVVYLITISMVTR